MKSTLVFILLVHTNFCYCQSKKQINFGGKYYGYISGANSGTGGYIKKGHYYIDGKITFYIALAQQMSDSQYSFLEDSLRQITLKTKKNAFVTYKYFNQPNPKTIADVTSPGYLLIKSGRIRNGVLAFSLISAPLTYGIILSINPIIGVVFGAISGVVMIVEEVRANNMLIEAGNKMLLK